MTDEKKERKPALNIALSEEFKSALDAYLKERKLTGANFGRTLLADAIGYALDNEPKSSRTRKHETEFAKELAHRFASLKSAALMSTLRKIMKAKIAGKTAEVAALETEALRIDTDADWLPEESKAREAALAVAKKLRAAKKYDGTDDDALDDMYDFVDDNYTLPALETS